LRPPLSNDFVFIAETTCFFPPVSDHDKFFVTSTSFDHDFFDDSSHLNSPCSFHNSNIMENVTDESMIIFNIPNIRKGNGRLILPVHYEEELNDDCVVMINVHVNL
jgi:hypothetical protein